MLTQLRESLRMRKKKVTLYLFHCNEMMKILNCLGIQGTWLLYFQRQTSSRITATTDEAAEAKEETLRSHTHEVCQTFQPSATILRKGDVRPLTPNILLSKMWILPEFKAYLPLKPKPLPVLYLEHNGS